MSRRAGLSRPSPGAQQQTGSSGSGSGNGSRASRRSSGGAGPSTSSRQDRFSSQRERQRLRRVAEDGDDDDDDGEEEGDEEEEEEEEAEANDADAADADADEDADEDESNLPDTYRVPKSQHLLVVTESVKKAVKALGKEDVAKRVNELVRLALFCEYRRQPIRRDEISKRVLGKGATRAFPYIFNRAQSRLRSVFCYELVPMRAKGAGADAAEFESVQQSVGQDETQGGKRRKSGGAAAAASKGKGKDADVDADAAEGVDADAEETTTAGKAAAPKAYALRSILPSVMIQAMTTPNDHMAQVNRPSNAADADADADAGASCMLNWNRADGQLGSMGLTWLILGFILLHQRSLPGNQFSALLHRLGLEKTTRLPTSLRPDAQRQQQRRRRRRDQYDDDESIPPDTSTHPSTLRTFLAQLVKHGYLESTKIKDAPSDTAGTLGGGANSEDAHIEWKWGPRAHAEVGEEAVAKFITEVYVAGGDDEVLAVATQAYTQQQSPTHAQQAQTTPTRARASGSSRSQIQAQTQAQTQPRLSPEAQRRQTQQSQAVRKEIERAAGSQLTT